MHLVKVQDDDSSLQLRASNDLRFIRQTMERASSFTAVPGWGFVAMGGIALAAAAFAKTAETSTSWLYVWLTTAIVAGTVGAIAMWRKSKRVNAPLFTGAGSRFLVSLTPPLFAGAILTHVLFYGDQHEVLPGVWLLMYGVTILTGGAFAIRPVLVLGGCFAALGCGALWAAPHHGDLFMAIGFGGLHVLFGILIARRHGG